MGLFQIRLRILLCVSLTLSLSLSSRFGLGHMTSSFNLIIFRAHFEEAMSKYVEGPPLTVFNRQTFRLFVFVMEIRICYRSDLIG